MMASVNFWNELTHFLARAWEVLVLFLIPVGGGIPAGVLLAKNRGFPWPFTSFLYFISDVMLACVFEPLMLVLIRMSRRSPRHAGIAEVIKKALARTTSAYGTHLGPLALIAVAFGVDPMTGRVVARVAGHGFLTGWAIAITGDMIYYLVIMASTLWLNGVLGNETQTTAVILVLMLLLPGVIRRIRS